MKTKVLGVITMFLLGTSMVFAQAKSEKFKVYGNCGMCEARIEKAAKAVPGVNSADWDMETKMMEVSFNDSKTDVDKIELAIAGVGHDTENHKAKDSVYDKLPGCCQYERAVIKEN